MNAISDPLPVSTTAETITPAAESSGVYAPASSTDFAYLLSIVSVAALGGFLFGFDSGVINGTVTALSAAFGSSTIGTGFSVASMLLGCAAGALLIGPLADAFGRKPSLLLAAVLFSVSAWGSGIADGTVEFIIYRLIGGVGVGAASVLAPAYISEVAPPHLRGRLTSLQQLGIVVGLFMAFMSNYLIARAAGGAGSDFALGFAAWRWMFWVELVPALALLVGTLLIPESPRYLVSVGRTAEASKVFRRTTDGDPADVIESVRRSLSTDHRPRIGDLFVGNRVRLIVWVGIVLSVFQQFVGINVVFYYGEVLWRSVGFTEAQALQVNLLAGAVNIASTFVAIAFIDKIGRRPLLALGSGGMAMSLAVVAIALSSGSTGVSGDVSLGPVAGPAALIAANVYVFCFGASWGPCVWVLLGEMFQNQIRGAALSASAGAQWVANFAVTMTFPIMLAGLGAGAAYAIYAAFAGLSLLFVFRFVRETRGLSLEEMPQ
jgi:SP family sugar:H+ symporter-like MFS transporter